MSTIGFHGYELKSSHPLNSRSETSTREGALLRVEFPGIGEGFADCHPWPELGDLPLASQLEALIYGRPSRLLERSLEFARLDAEARACGRNVFDDLEIPPSHFLVTDRSRFHAEQALTVMSQGFDRLKIKVGRDLGDEARWLRTLAEKTPERLFFRLDFNGSGTSDSIADFLAALRGMEGRIEFLEDPIPWNSSQWRDLQSRTEIPLALDSGVESASPGEWLPSIIVLKPAVQCPEALTSPLEMRRKHFVITSYLDHPLGQLGAAYWAAKMMKESGPSLLPCGLTSHTVYESNPFSEALGIRGARLIPPSGTGFGFDDLLEKLSWETLR